MPEKRQQTAEVEKGGRPSKILEGWTRDQESWDDHSTAGKILVAIRGGNYRDVAARWAGLDPSNLRRWLQRGTEHANDLHIRESDLPYVHFRTALDRAETSYEIEAVLRATRAAETPESILRILGRRHPERWGSNREQLNVNLSGQVETGIVPGAIARAVLEDPKRREAALELLNIVAEGEAEASRAASQASDAEDHDSVALEVSIVLGEREMPSDAGSDDGEAEDAVSE